MSVAEIPDDANRTGSTAWPAASYEEQWWEVEEDQQTRANRIRSGRYFATIPAKIAELNWQLDSALCALSEAAALEATKFDFRNGSETYSYDIVLLRSEAAASSQIEQLTASPRAIMQAEIGDTSKPNASLIAANTSALRMGLSKVQELTIDSILQVHGILLASVPKLNPGHLRRVPVWIGGSSPVDARFVGAPWESIPELMNDLVAYCKRTDIPVMVQAALAHAQFETIHPFEDGNGRVGRALVHMHLRAAGVMSQAVLPVSGQLLQRSAEYYNALDQYRDGTPEPIVRLFAESMLDAVSNGTQLMRDVGQVSDDWNSRLNTRSDSGARILADYALRQPVFTADSARAELGLNSTKFYRAADTLTEAGILVRSKFYRDSDVWRAQPILDAMAGFAERAGFRNQ